MYDRPMNPIWRTQLLVYGNYTRVRMKCWAKRKKKVCALLQSVCVALQGTLHIKYEQMLFSNCSRNIGFVKQKAGSPWAYQACLRRYNVMLDICHTFIKIKGFYGFWCDIGFAAKNKILCDEEEQDYMWWDALQLFTFALELELNAFWSSWSLIKATIAQANIWCEIKNDNAHMGFERRGS